MGSQKRAGLHVIVGPMFSGKSAELIHWLKLYKVQGAPVAAFTHGLSVQQGEGFIKSRNGETFPARAIQQVMHLAPQLDAFRPGWVLAFDEFQFFTPEDAGIVIELAKDHYVLVAGLDTDFRREPFESMQVLMSKGKDLPCYTETWVKAVCHKCGQHNAVYTQRLVNGKPAPYDSPLILPGDQGLYEARCEACYEPPVRDRGGMSGAALPRRQAWSSTLASGEGRAVRTRSIRLLPTLCRLLRSVLRKRSSKSSLL